MNKCQKNKEKTQKFMMLAANVISTLTVCTLLIIGIYAELLKSFLTLQAKKSNKLNVFLLLKSPGITRGFCGLDGEFKH